MMWSDTSNIRLIAMVAIESVVATLQQRSRYQAISWNRHKPPAIVRGGGDPGCGANPKARACVQQPRVPGGLQELKEGSFGSFTSLVASRKIHWNY
jgi:hypothetical protein